MVRTNPNAKCLIPSDPVATSPMARSRRDRPISTHLEGHAAADGDVARDREVVELQDGRDGAEAREVVADLGELLPELDERHRREGSLRVHDELSVRQRVQIRLHEQEVG